MNEFIYWGVFAGFGVIVVLYGLWMILADRADQGTADALARAADGPTLRLVNRSQPGVGTSGKRDPDPEPDGGGSPPPKGSSAEDDRPTRTFWKGK